jgi:hypothetical protein
MLDGSACVLVVARNRFQVAYRPTAVQALVLMWVFRHFSCLPAVVLNSWQRSLLRRISTSAPTVPLPCARNEIIGTVEMGEPWLETRDGCLPKKLAVYLENLPY